MQNDTDLQVLPSSTNPFLEVTRWIAPIHLVTPSAHARFSQESAGAWQRGQSSEDSLTLGAISAEPPIEAVLWVL